MGNSEQIKTAMERAVRVITRQPSVGRIKDVMHIDMAADGCCAISDGDATMTIDLS